MKWNESVTLEFVKTYLKHECLWNPLHPGYKLKYQREKAYTDIGTEFKASTMKSLSILEVKLKIKNLRTTYVQQVHKILEKSSPDCIYEPSLIWFQEMDRCLKHVSTNRFSSYTNVQEIPEVDSSSQIWVDQQLAGVCTEDVHPDPLIPQTDDEHEVTKSDATSSKLKRQRRKSPAQFKRNKKKRLKYKPSTNYLTDSNSDSPGKDFTPKEDEFDFYGKYIASQLRKMDLRKALKLQLEFQSLVSEVRISEISDHKPSF